MTPTVWQGCYNEGWRDLIVPAAFAHPAKMARGLVVRIFDYLLESGALHRGDTCLDPFGGIGTTAIEGASRGVKVVCCELEPKFVELARLNMALHRRTWEGMGFPVPVIVEGDSRYLRTVLQAAHAIVSSPPYSAGGMNSHKQTTPEAHQTHEAAREKYPGWCVGRTEWVRAYGTTEGQLGILKEGAGVDAVVSSPPYEEIATGAGGLNTKPPQHEGQQGGRSASSASQDTDQRYGETDGQLARFPKGEVDAVISSPPYEESVNSERSGIDWSRVSTERSGGPPKTANSQGVTPFAYGQTDGQIGAMSGGDGVDAVVSSPPFTQGYAGGGGINVKGYGPDGADKVGERTYQGTGAEREPGNLELLTLGAVEAVVSSPPYEASVNAGTSGIDRSLANPAHHSGSATNSQDAMPFAYGKTDGQLGAAQGETFWQAAQQVVRECYALLKPGGVAVWVVKAFVRDKKLVDFPGDWRRLCEHAGFETVEEIHASLVEEEVVPGLFEDKTVTRERKSFFRRLAEKKGSPKIDWETVWIMRKP